MLNKKSDSKVSHFKKSGKAKLVELSRDGHTISWGYSGASIVDAKNQTASNKELTGNDAYLNLQNLSCTVLYENIYNNVDLEVINSTVGVKENIILKDSNTKNAFKIEYNIGDLTAESKDSQTIELKDSTGTILYTISAPYMMDANGKKSEALELKVLQNNKGKLSVKLTADKSWLKDSERVYPVTIDPYFIYNGTTSNYSWTYIESADPNTPNGNEQYLYTGTFINGEDQRSLIKLKALPNLGIGDIIVNATVNLFFMPQDPFTTSYVGVYPVTKDWDENNETWNSFGTGGYAQNLIDYKKFVTNQEAGWIEWDITELMKKWHNDPDSNFGFMLKTVDNTDNYQNMRFAAPNFAFDEDDEAYQALRPCFVISYCNNIGLEDYWSYTPVSAGSAGIAYINDYSGNLVFQTAIADTYGLNLTASSYLTYNSNMADSSYFGFSSSFGFGWKMNLYQTVLQTNQHALKVTDKAVYPYVYTDEDGTDHYFYEKEDSESDTVQYLDEDGKGLELEVKDTEFIITNKDKSTFHFARSTNLLTKIVNSTGQEVKINYVSGSNKISSITDANDNTISISYNGNVSSITDPSGRATLFGYDTEGDYLTSVTTPDNKTVYYTYDTDGLLTRVTDIDGTYITFAYSENGSRGVKTVQEFAADGTEGQKLTFDRTKYNTTIMRSAGTDCDFGTNDDIITNYQFDNFGRTTSVSCKTAGGEDLGAAAATYTPALNSNASNIKAINKVSQSYSLGANRENLLVNHNLESTTNWKSSAWGADDDNTVTFTASKNTSSPLYGNGTLRIKVDSVTGDARGRVYQDVSAEDIEAGATYTLSAYVRTESITPVSGAESYGAVISAAIFHTNGSITGKYSDHISTTTNTDINKGYRRISVTFTAPADISKIRINLALRAATGTAYFDAVQLEKSSAPSSYNLLENASLERCESLAVPDSWTGSNNLTLSNSYDKYSTGHIDGNKSFRIKGEVDKCKNIYQDVDVPTDSSELDTYILSGWATANSVPKETNSSCFKLLACVYFTDGTYKNNNIYFNTTLEQGTWQYATSAFTLSDGTDTTKTPDYIRVYLSYDMQGNYAYFDNISLTKEAVPSYTYDEEGDMISVVANAEQNATYDYENNLLTEYIDPNGNKYTYEYNEETKLLTSATTQKGAKISYEYDESGNTLSAEVSATGLPSIRSEASYDYPTEGDTTYSITTSDQDDKSATEVYNSKTGTLQSVTDTKGITTNYTYDPNTDQVLSVAKNNQSVEYTYDDYYRLSKISHEGTEYTFTYDAFGNPIDTKVGSRTLSTNHYDSNNGSLLSMTYGNGSTVAYTYDVFGNVKTLSYNGTKAVENFTDSAGNINRTHDLLTNLEHRVTYDTTGRLVSKEVLDLTASGDRWLRSLEYDYDLNNNVTYIAYADKQGSNVTQYEYGLDNLLEKTTLDNDQEVTYNYDTFGRLTSKVLNTTNNLNYAYTYADSLRESVEGKTYTTTKLYTETIGNTTYKYTYDTYGNITNILKVNSDGTETLLCSYTYDDYNQLIVVKDYEHSEQVNYTYNQAGNITRRYRYQMNSSWVPIDTLEDVRYVYGNSEWKDLLTSYNGQALTYDSIGNPLTYRDGISFTWQNGRQLASYSDATQNITYTYDASGLRTSKVINEIGDVYYTYENGRLIQMDHSGYIFDFNYDANGTPLGFRFNDDGDIAYYYYGLNSRGDIIAIYDESGAKIATHSYDAYGKLLTTNFTSEGLSYEARFAVNYNPLRYRGYVYDRETGFYYLQTRYYDPTACRFVNEDIYYDTGQGITGNNMFAYCNNNPVMYSDPTGELLAEHGGGGGGIYVGGCTGGAGGGGGYYFPSTYVPSDSFLYDIIKLFKKTSRVVSAIRTIDTVADLVAEKVDIKRRERESKVYFGAEIKNDKLEYTTTVMNYDEALAWSHATALSNVYSRNASWGLYTKQKSNAYTIACGLGVGTPIHENTTTIGYYMHYHLSGRKFGRYKHFHIWYGEPYGG